MAPTFSLHGPLPDVDLETADHGALAGLVAFGRFAHDFPRAPQTLSVLQCRTDARADIARMRRVADALADDEGLTLAEELERALYVCSHIYGDAEGCIAVSDEAREWIDIFGPDDVDWRLL